MKLSAFIRDNIEAILLEWEQFARAEQPITGDLSVSALRDHAKLMLDEIVVAIDVPESKVEQKEKSQGRKPQLSTVSAAVDHGLERLIQGFHIRLLMSEYRYLRSSILRLWYEQLPKEVLDVYELIRFNEAVDQLIQESIASYSTEKEQQVRQSQDKLRVHQIELEMQNAELLQAKEERESMLGKYTDLYDFAPVAYFTLDHVGAILAANLTAARFLGVELSRMLGVRFGLFVVNEHRQLFSGFLAKVFASESKESCELMLIPEGGSPHYVQIEAIAIGADQECRFAVIDINERKQAEEALRESDLKYDKLFHSKFSGMAFGEVVLDEKGRSVDYRFLEVNDAFEEMTGLQKEIVEGRTAREVMPGIEKSRFDFIAVHGDVALTGEETTFETYQEYLERWYLVHVYSPKSGFFVSIFSDITDRKRAEEHIKASLAEKEVMLKEIHHRVKNNLQVISSLVSMQAENLTDEKTRKEFDDVCGRVRSMALIHEKLYHTDDLARLNFADYSASLLHSLWNSQDVLAEKVKLKLELVPVTLTIETAMPCGLILNELASNALKHAFPNGSDGKVTVGLEHDTHTNTVCLWVHDNGVGLAPGLDWRNSSSLGLQLVQLLTSQLHGTVEIRTDIDTGTEFRVTFPLKG